MSPPGLIIAAPASGSGKTTVALGLARALTRRGLLVAPFKVGPDYIDPAFHSAAAGRPCRNLDSWAMRPDTLDSLRQTASGADIALCEGVMGLFDGALIADGGSDGSTADIAKLTGWPVVMVIDVRAMAGSAAAVLRGFAQHRAGVRVAGVIFNRVGAASHAETLKRSARQACPEIKILGCLPREESLILPERHLGLVQAIEHGDLQAFLDKAADFMAAHLDLDGLQNLAEKGRAVSHSGSATPIAPLGSRIAIAKDQAFAFAYPAILEGWRAQGAELSFFSPLADQAPDKTADAVYLPGGYPELHAGRLAGNSLFSAGMHEAAKRGAAIFGECGGYMSLGEGLIDKDGQSHAMLGLLPLATDFSKRKLHLGYREARLLTDGFLGKAGDGFRGHEFHYATIRSEASGQSLFLTRNASGAALGSVGLINGNICGSFIHLIDRL
jgi:cobyrinic acid a,c-diamide synthase